MSTLTYYSNTSTGVREMKDTIFEDVDNMISEITPSKTPFINSIGKGGAKQPLHEWLEDSATAPTSATTLNLVEGADATANAITPPLRVNNYCQIWGDTFQISETVIASDTIGRKEVAYETRRSMEKLARQMEYTAINSASSSAGAAASARATKGLVGFISTNDKTYGSYATTNDFDEAKLMSMAQACYEAGGEPSILLVAPPVARKIGGWNQSNRITVNAPQEGKKLVMAVAVLETPFGVIRVLIDRYIATASDSGNTYTSTYLYDPDLCEMAYLRSMKTTELAKAGDSRKFQSVVEAALVVKNEAAHSKCAKCATD